jgi:hypothetical protein
MPRATTLSTIGWHRQCRATPRSALNVPGNHRSKSWFDTFADCRRCGYEPTRWLNDIENDPARLHRRVSAGGPPALASYQPMSSSSLSALMRQTIAASRRLPVV